MAMLKHNTWWHVAIGAMSKRYKPLTQWANITYGDMCHHNPLRWRRGMSHQKRPLQVLSRSWNLSNQVVGHLLCVPNHVHPSSRHVIKQKPTNCHVSIMCPTWPSGDPTPKTEETHARSRNWKWEAEEHPVLVIVQQSKSKVLEEGPMFCFQGKPKKPDVEENLQVLQISWVLCHLSATCGTQGHQWPKSAKTLCLPWAYQIVPSPTQADPQLHSVVKLPWMNCTVPKKVPNLCIIVMRCGDRC